jgi:hypothetical protein
MPEANILFRLDGADKPPWGDYGHILVHGMSMHLGRREGIIQLERIGPSIAPITFPGSGDIVVTQDFRSKIERSGLTGFTFLPVIKHHIVELDWESWDTTAEEPAELPESGEPEDYILGQPHSPTASQALGNLWELALHYGIDVERDKTHVRLLAETWDGSDFFIARTTRIKSVSLKARRWLEQNFGDYVEFRPINP